MIRSASLRESPGFTLTMSRLITSPTFVELGSPPPAVVVLDDELEGSRGRDVVDLFQSAHPNVEIILVESRTPETPRGIAHGLFYSGMKPIARGTLLELIEDAVPGRLHHEPVSGR